MGEKDAQQAIIIQKMVKDLNLGIKVILGETVGKLICYELRNMRLTKEERKKAPVIYQALKAQKVRIKKGEQNVNKIRAIIRNMVSSKKNAKIDYVEIVNKETLKLVKILKGEILIAVAAKFGKTRLIDNITINV